MPLRESSKEVIMKILKKHIMVTIVLCLSVVGLIQAQETDNCTPIQFNVYWEETDFCNTTIDLSEVRHVISPDGIPALNNPVMETIADAEGWLNPLSPVISVEIDGEARAYPLAILVFHEIANDEIADTAVAVTYCPLCNSSIVFNSTIDATTLEFGVSGNLRNSDLIMYDRQTDSWWQQLTGEGIVGEYAGQLLDIIPSQVIGFAQFVELYPDGMVLSRPITDGRYGEIPQHYANYERPFLFTGDYDERLPATAHVLATTIGNTSIAYPFESLASQHVINDMIEDGAIVIFWQSGMAAMMDNEIVDNSRDIGTANMYVPVLDDGSVLTFRYDDVNHTIVDNESNSTWNAFGQAIDGDLIGTQLQAVIAAPHFWFAWAAFNPDTLIYEQG